MAKVSITSDRLSMNTFKEITLTNGTTDGFLIDATWADNKRLLVFQNTAGSTGTLIVKKGNGYAGVKDLDTYTISAGGIAVIRIDDAWFKNVTGTDKDKVLVVPSATSIKCSVVELP